MLLVREVEQEQQELQVYMLEVILEITEQQKNLITHFKYSLLVHGRVVLLLILVEEVLIKEE